MLHIDAPVTILLDASILRLHNAISELESTFLEYELSTTRSSENEALFNEPTIVRTRNFFTAISSAWERNSLWHQN